MGIKAVFGSNLKHFRKQRRLSQEQLAEKLDISPKHLSTIETGAGFVSAELLEKLTETLQVSASALFYTAGETSTDDSLLNRIDQIIEKELLRTALSIKIQMRHPENVG
jgi:transcriptional regulator with XRE-family HTH domain